MVEAHSCVETRRGRGFIQGLVLKVPVGEVAAKALQEGLIVITAGANVLRLVPPLVIEKEDIDEMAAILNKILAGYDE